MLGRAALRGALAGLAGTAAMTLGEQVEQRFPGRPDSYVPARTLTALATGRRLPGSARPPVRNHLMRWGTGAAVGALRGILAASGLRGLAGGGLGPLGPAGDRPDARERHRRRVPAVDLVGPRPGRRRRREG